MKNKITLLCILTIAGLITWYFSEFKIESTPESSFSFSPQKAAINSEAGKIANEENTFKSTKEKLSLDEDWCIAINDLDEKSRALAREESNEWAVTRGDILIPNYDSYFNQANSGLLEPYIDLATPELIKFASENDNFALLTLLQRENLSLAVKDKSAMQLIVLGNTSIALSHFVIQEMLYAEHLFKISNKVSDEVKFHLMSALAFVSYGLDRLDTTALNSYLNFLRRHNNGLFEIPPEKLLTEKEVSEIEKYKKNFIRKIDEERDKIYLKPINEINIPRIAIHDFQIELATIYNEYENLTEGSKILPEASKSSLKKSECVVKIIEMQKSS